MRGKEKQRGNERKSERQEECNEGWEGGGREREREPFMKTISENGGIESWG